jgi:TetR/AcrR family transcriptional regulator, cholesterol catabolism regulator
MTMSTPEKILAVVVSMIESNGTDSVQLVEVAKRARVSLSTVYKHFTSRDELIVAAIESWMDANVYRSLPENSSSDPLFDALMRYFRHIFEPWEENPNMAEAFMRARLSPSGGRLLLQGSAATEASMKKVMKGVDPALAEDVLMIVGNVIYALVFRYATEDLALTEIMSTLERTLRRLTGTAPVTAMLQRSARQPAKRK